MSAKSDEDEVLCACCGIAAVDDVKLAECNGGCDLVKYCSDKCRETHREQHEDACKQQTAELHDKKLFEQPELLHLFRRWLECRTLGANTIVESISAIECLPKIKVFGIFGICFTVL